VCTLFPHKEQLNTRAANKNSDGPQAAANLSVDYNSGQQYTYAWLDWWLAP